MNEVKKYDLVIIGTTQARFCFYGEHCSIPAKNLAMNYCSFYSQKKALEDNKKSINRGAMVLLTIQYPIYLCDHDSNKELLRVPVEWMQNYEESLKQNLYKNSFTIKEIQIRVDKLIGGWEREAFPFTIRNYSSKNDFDNRQKRLRRSIDLHQAIIDYCLTNGWRPVLVGLPCCKELGSSIPYEFVNDCFLKCVRSLSGNNDIPFLDYSTDEELSSIQNYLDIWYLNYAGRQVFTRKLIDDLGL